MYRNETSYGRERESRSLVHWRSIFAGGVVALGLMALLTALWTALGFASEVDVIRDNIEWFIGGSAIFSLFVGGILAGWLHGLRGAAAGFVNGLILWGLLVVTLLSVGIPAAANVLNLGQGSDTATTGLQTDGVWTTFWSMLIALVAAGLGGLIGGAMSRGAHRGQRREVEYQRHDRQYVGDDDRGYVGDDDRGYVGDDDRGFEQRREVQQAPAPVTGTAGASEPTEFYPPPTRRRSA